MRLCALFVCVAAGIILAIHPATLRGDSDSAPSSNGLAPELSAEQTVQAIHDHPSEYWVIDPSYKSVAVIARKLIPLLREDSDITIVAIDKETNRMLIRANAEKWQKVKEIVKRLDVGSPHAPYAVSIQLQRMDAATTAKMLNVIMAMKGLVDGDCDFQLVVVKIQNRVVMAGSNNNLQEAKEILRWLDDRSE